METEIEVNSNYHDKLGSVIFNNISRNYVEIKEGITYCINECINIIKKYEKTKEEVKDELNISELERETDEEILKELNDAIKERIDMYEIDYENKTNELEKYESLDKKTIVICSLQNKKNKNDEKNNDITLEHLANRSNWHLMFFASINPVEFKEFEEYSVFIKNLKNLNLSYAFYDSLDEADKNKEKFNKYLFAVAFQDNKYKILKDLDDSLSENLDNELS